MSGNQFDLLVIGEGLSGIVAAAAAAAQGHRVMLTSTGPGSLVLGSACVDLDGIEGQDMADAAYGGEHLEEAIRFFLQLNAQAGCAYEGGIRDTRQVPTIMGTFQNVSLAPQSLWKGGSGSASKVVVVGIDSLSSFDPNFVAERLSFHSCQLGTNTAYRTVTIKLPQDHPRALTTLDVATRLDRDAGYRDALIVALRSIVQGAELLILPGILGVRASDNDISEIEAAVGCAICDLPTLPPSVPGLRLLYRLERHLGANGVEIFTGFAVQRLCMEGDWCTGIMMDTPGRPRLIQSDSVVLASGRFSHLLGHKGPAEPGIAEAMPINQDLQPVNESGTVVARNLFACGNAMTKREPQYGNAIAILTGYQAGMLACGKGVQYATR